MEETFLSCFLPFLALKLAAVLLICVGHNTGKQACFLLHHFLGINILQQWLNWLKLGETHKVNIKNKTVLLM